MSAVPQIGHIDVLVVVAHRTTVIAALKAR
jgi:hypothetical protein